MFLSHRCAQVWRGSQYIHSQGGGLKYSSAWNALNWVSKEIGGECPVMTSMYLEYSQSNETKKGFVNYYVTFKK